MPGIRLIHPTSRNVRYTVVEAKNPYTLPFVCSSPLNGGCGSVHLFKTHHLNLDDTGSVIISTGVYERIKDRLVLDGFMLANEVAKPPPIVVLSGAERPMPILFSPSNMENH